MKKYILYILLLSFIAFPAIAQVRPSYNQGFVQHGSLSKRPNLWKGLVGCWKPSLGVTGINTLRDVSGYGNHGAGDLVTLGDWVIGGNPKVPGYALDFDGTNNMEMGDVTFFDGKPKISFSLWLKKTGDSTTMYVYGKERTLELRVMSGGVNGYTLRVNHSNIAFSAAPTNDVWTHITVVFDNAVTNGTILYENGVPLSAITISTGTPNDTANPHYIGGRETFRFKGLINDVRTYDRILSVSEALDTYQYPNAMFERRDVILVKPPAAPAPTGETTQVIIISQLFKRYFKGFEFLYN